MCLIAPLIVWLAKAWCWLFHVPWHDAGEWMPYDFADWERSVHCKRCGRWWRETR